VVAALAVNAVRGGDDAYGKPDDACAEHDGLGFAEVGAVFCEHGEIGKGEDGEAEEACVIEGIDAEYGVAIGGGF